MKLFAVLFSVLISLLLSACVTSQQGRGALDEKQTAHEAYKQTIIRNNPHFTRCYFQGLQNDRSLKGTVTVNFRVNQAGQLQKAEISPKNTTIEDDDMKACILSTLRRVKFPQRKDAMAVDMNYPFIFGK